MYWSRIDPKKFATPFLTATNRPQTFATPTLKKFATPTLKKKVATPTLNAPISHAHPNAHKPENL